VFVEVKRRRTLADAAHALAPRQQARLLAAAEAWLAAATAAPAGAVRFDLVVVDGAGRVRRIVDVLRRES
jgi:putative endonuclease